MLCQRTVESIGELVEEDGVWTGKDRKACGCSVPALSFLLRDQTARSLPRSGCQGFSVDSSRSSRRGLAAATGRAGGSDPRTERTLLMSHLSVRGCGAVLPTGSFNRGLSWLP